MAEGGHLPNSFGQDNLAENVQEQKDEIVALQAIYENTNRLKINCSLDDEASPNTDNQQFAIELSVPIEVEGEKMVLEVWIPNMTGPDETAASKPDTTNPKSLFSRSDSGQRWVASVDITHLTPISLQVILPQSYPSHAPPVFTLSAMWLSSEQLTALCRQLDKLWGDNSGMPVLYTWCDWLENNTLSLLGIESKLILVSYVIEDEDRDPRALPECSDIEFGLKHLIDYDRIVELEQFDKSCHECCVCFEEKPGRQFYRLLECDHHICRICVRDYCTLHVNDGTVQSLKCPESECDCDIHPSVIGSVLKPEALAKWERLTLQKCLDRMGDVTYCPRCNSVVIEEEDKGLFLAQCTACFFSFCTQCNQSWHQGERCKTAEEELGELEVLSAKARNEHDRERIRKLRQQKLEEDQSAHAIKQTSQRCPHCDAPIFKFAGCNKVTCSQCRKCMCYLCGKAINNYDHFNDTKCTIFTDTPAIHIQMAVQVYPEGYLRVQEAVAGDPREAIQRIMPCPRCRQRNLREDNNNHIKCWSCKTNMCFSCKQTISGQVTAHFSVRSKCSQHS